MKAIVIQLARLGAAVVAVYVGLLLLTLLLVRPDRAHTPLDAARAGSSLYLTEPKYVFLSRSRLNTTSDKLFVLGASNALVGFKQTELAPLLPHREVHNISVSGSNITQLEQIVGLVHEVQSPAARRQATFVLGLWYGVFAADQARWHTPDRHPGDTDIDLERYRYGFYRRTERGPEALLPARFSQAGAALVHPYLVLDMLARDATRSLREQLAGKPPKLTDQERNARLIGATEQQQYLTFWRRYMGSVDALSDPPFATLTRTVDRILAEGGRVVLVDMPIPRWHAQGSPIHADYRRRMAELLPLLAAREGVAVLRMQNDADQDFSDEVHPKPRVTAAWARELASVPYVNSNERDEHEHRSTLRQADAGISRRIR